MNSPIQHCLSLIYNSIPTPILQEAFIPKGVVATNSLDHYIRQEVIEKRVLLDCNLYAGKHTQIHLTSDMLEHTNSFSHTTPDIIYRIPPEKREYKDIAEVLSLSLTPMYTKGGQLGYGHGHTTASVARDVLNSHTWADAIVTPRPIKLAGDLVRLDPPIYYYTEWILSCLLEYDRNFTNMNTSAIRPFSELVLSATKSYCYNKLILMIENAYLVGGQELGRFKEIVDRYEGEEEKYRELLMDFRGGATADPEVLNKIVQLMF